MLIRMQPAAMLQVGSDRAVEEFVALARRGLTPPRHPVRGEIETYTFCWTPVVDVDGILMSCCNSVRGVSLAVLRGRMTGQWWAKFESNEIQTYLERHDTIEKAQRVAEDFATEHIPILPPVAFNA